jgi:CubicO group peptidase (beta-lactamase class C family)
MEKLDVTSFGAVIRTWEQGGGESFSGAILVSQDKKPVLKKAYGYANRAESLPNQIDTRFQMASGCKIFTAVAICQLVEQGRLSFDARLQDCVDAGFPNFDARVTVRHLLTHTSGITSYFEEDVNPDYEALWQNLPVYGMRETRDFLPLFQHKMQKFEPGARFEYNDGGFILLGLIVEAVSGLSFADYVTSYVFQPANMADSGYFCADRLPPRTALAYIEEKDGSWRTNTFAVPIVGGPDGGAYTTASDMVRFWDALFAYKLLGSEMTETMLSSHVRAEGARAGVHYGYGVWMFVCDDGTRIPYVEGWDPGVAFLSAIHLREKTTTTILGNTNRSVWRIYDVISEVIESA